MERDKQSGIENVSVVAGMKAVENMNSHVSTESVKGEVISKAGADPGMENVTGSAGAKYGGRD